MHFNLILITSCWLISHVGLVWSQDVITAPSVGIGRMIGQGGIIGDDIAFVKISPQQVFTIDGKDHMPPQYGMPNIPITNMVPRHFIVNDHMQSPIIPIDFMGQMQAPPLSYTPPKIKPKQQSKPKTEGHRAASATAHRASTTRPLTPPGRKKKNERKTSSSENERRRLENHRKSHVTPRPSARKAKKIESSASTLSQVSLDTNLFPQKASSDSTAQIKAIDVQCAKKAMQVRIQFDKVFEGVIYSKGHFNDESCRYVFPESHGRVYEFVVLLDKCGTNFMEATDQGGQTYLENTLIIQNEPNVQEIWDTARRIRCLWTGQLDKRVSSNMKIDSLDIVSVTYSGDTVDSYMDIQLGRGPTAPPVTGLVKIGETLTMVITVHGGDEHDVRVKDCLAHDGDSKNSIQLTDTNGCVLKRKLMGPWQKTRSPSKDGASSAIVAYSYFQAFKFPDKMEVFLECNIEICKHDCPVICEDEILGRSASGNSRHRRSKSVLVAARASTTLVEPVEPVRLLRGIRVVSQDDIAVSGRSDNGTIPIHRQISRSRSDSRKNGLGNVCMSTPSFVTALVVVLLILILACLMTAALCLRVRSNHRTMRNKRVHR